MNERHKEMMNEINAGANWPVTASGQPGAAKSRHGVKIVCRILSACGMLPLVVLSLIANDAFAGTATFTTAETTSWTAPAGVSSVTVEVWGGGGAGGGQNLNSDGGGGGGGGAYAKKNTITVTPLSNYTVVVGAEGIAVAGGTGGTGGDSYFIDSSTVMAKGGSGGAPSTGTPPPGGLGGQLSASVGDVKYDGGRGEDGRDSNAGSGGYGGSSAGTGAHGFPTVQTAWSTITYPTTSTPAGAGPGGDGGGNSTNGFAPASGNGGGGGGAGEGTNTSGGNGAAGKVIISWVDPNAAPTLSISQPDGTGDTVTVGASYSITYSLADSDSVVTAAFYYDTDNTGLNGTAISGACATAAEGSGVTCSWDTTGVTPGSYYVYGITNDGVNPQVSAYSPGMITINAAAPTCIRNAPTFSINPTSQNVKTNQSVVYTLTVVNNDTAECADSSTFNIAITSETGDTAAFTLPSVRSATSVSVAAGASNATVTLTVTSAATAIVGKVLTSLLTLSDATNHNGMNQTDSVVTTVANFDPMIHSSLSTGSTKWSSNWGTAAVGSKYGEFTCATCHTRSTTNIKRVKTTLTSGTADKFPIEAASGAIQFLTAVDSSSHFGDDLAAGRTTSNRICEGCHSQNKYHNYNTANNVGGILTHENNKDCVTCHQHNKGFGASCTTCHPTYPEPPATNAHVTHAGSAGYAFLCTVCHPQDHDGTAADIAFTGVAATWAGATYTSADKTCSSLYCHGSAPADWDAGTGGACGDCHGAATTGRPDGVGEPTGGSHLTTSHQVACTNCHSHDGTDKTEHVNGPVNANGDALVSSAGTSITTYTYGTTLASSPDPDGYKYSGGTCATSCHSDGVWGGSGGCTFCHGGSGLYYPQAGSAPNRVAEHADHIYALETKLGYTHGTTADAEQKAMCVYCHNDTNGVGGTGHNDGGVAEVGAFNPMWNGATADSDGALDAGKTCSNIDCHYSTTTADTWYGTGTATCTYCHAGDAAYAAGSLPGVHDAHVDEVADGGRDKTCVTCHSGSATYANDHANGSSGTEVAFSGSTTYTYNDTNNTCGSATNNGLGCHATGTPDWDVPFAVTVCINCHTNTTNTAVNPTSGLHAAGPTVSGQAHNQTLGGSGCASCHTVAALSTHANGAFTGNGTTDRTQMGLPATAGNGYTATANNVGSCVGTWLTGCHTGAGDQGTWARKWDASIHYVSTGAECAGCHGGFNNDWTFGSTANTTDGSVEHNRNWDGDANTSEVIGNHSNGTDKKCNTCHVYGDAAYILTGAGKHHRDGNITMNSTGGYQRTTTTPNYGCTSTCHSSNTNHGLENSSWTLGTLAGPALTCTSCHAGTGTGALKVGSTSPHVIRGTKAGMNTFNACEDCHPSTKHNGIASGKVFIPEKTTVGIDFTAVLNGAGTGDDEHTNDGGTTAGFWLGGNATTGTTEAEICWNCHSNTTTNQTVEISEWGTNTGGTYNYGSVAAGNLNWTTTTWSSANFAYKNGPLYTRPIRSSSTNTGDDTTRGDASIHATGGTVGTQSNVLSQVRCSYCHDVHNSYGTVDGKPFLRGSWRVNAYKEDGAPRTGAQTYSATQNFGAVPRGGGTNLNVLGGWQIDINNGNPNSGAYAYATNDALCASCHTQAAIEAAAPLHKNAVKGFTNDTTSNTTGPTNRNILRVGTYTGTEYNPSRGGTMTTHSSTVGAPKMGYNVTSDTGTTATEQNGLRDVDRDNLWVAGNGIYNLSGTNTGRYAYQAIPLGAAGVSGVTQDLTTVQADYHSFTCSKCHNPHASRLPRLMITNCLDVNVNTWDDTLTLTTNTAYTRSTANNPANINTLAYFSAAQNCHRYTENASGATRGTVMEKGWNAVTPW